MRTIISKSTTFTGFEPTVKDYEYKVKTISISMVPPTICVVTNVVVLCLFWTISMGHVLAKLLKKTTPQNHGFIKIPQSSH